MELTGNATSENVVKGKTFYNTDPKDQITGTLELSGNAVAGEVLNGRTFYKDNPTSKITGTMPNKGAITKTINPGESYTIPAGYHNGSGKVTANPNQNSDTYTFAANDTGDTKDLGATNTYRYVNAKNVYAKGKVDAIINGTNRGCGTNTVSWSGGGQSRSITATVTTDKAYRSFVVVALSQETNRESDNDSNGFSLSGPTVSNNKGLSKTSLYTSGDLTLTGGHQKLTAEFYKDVPSGTTFTVTGGGSIYSGWGHQPTCRVIIYGVGLIPA